MAKFKNKKYEYTHKHTAKNPRQDKQAIKCNPKALTPNVNVADLIERNCAWARISNEWHTKVEKLLDLNELPFFIAVTRISPLVFSSSSFFFLIIDSLCACLHMNVYVLCMH